MFGLKIFSQFSILAQIFIVWLHNLDEKPLRFAQQSPEVTLQNHFWRKKGKSAKISLTLCLNTKQMSLAFSGWKVIL